ncbi:MAG: hypothetical protein ACT6S0_04875 [Roseateles sp.]|uniref:hypothetical protein n=1 Tax=Roseateles sp. TaxID=1971397 RepID=UPI0040366303
MLRATGTRQHTLIRTGNAEFLADDGALPGVSIYCHDEVTAAGTGTLRYTHATTSLAWLAPGESSYGAEVNIGAVVNASTVAIFTLPGASAGKQLYVYVAPTLTGTVRTGVMTRRVRVEPVTGAKSMTWTRASNVRAINQADHGRRIGDFVICFGPSGNVRHDFITAVTANSYTIPDPGADQPVAQTGRAYGVRNIVINGTGATLDYRKGALTTAAMSNLHAVILNACSDVELINLEVSNTTKYALLLSGYKNVKVSGFRTFRDDSSNVAGNSDVVHPLGPGRGLVVERTRAQGGDNLIGVGCSDFFDYVLNLPAYGDLSLIGGRVTDSWGENTHQQPVRFYNGNGTNAIRDWTVDGIYGTYDTNVDAAVAVIMDTMSNIDGNGIVGMVDSGATNIDGLTLRNISATRVDGQPSCAFISRGAGTRRGLKIDRLRPRTFSVSTSATVHIEDSTWEGVEAEVFGAGSFAGAIIGLFGTGTIRDLRVDATQLVWDNALGSGARGAVVLLNNANAVITNLRVRVLGSDSSASGNKANVVWINNGTVTRYYVTGHFGAGTDAILRVSNGSCTYFTANDLEHEGSFVAVADAPVNHINLNEVYHWNGASSCIAYNVAAGGTVRVRARQVRCSNRFIRNTAGSTAFLLEAQSTELTSSVFVVDAGTPALRLQGPTDISMDGALLDATVGNHAPGASFYNTNAAFGAPGVGAYVRGATTWTRVAA